MKRYAFTMLELIFVILVIGILAVLAMPNFNNNQLQQVTEQVAGHIRYAQHLAMVDDKYNPMDQYWYKELWRVRFYQNGGTWYYTVFSDLDQNGNADYGAGKKEIAIDPLLHINMHVSNDNKYMNLTDTFGITSVTSTCDNGFLDVFFDQMGRPYADTMDVTNQFANMLANDCNITLAHNSGKNAIITIHPISGFVSVSYP